MEETLRKLLLEENKKYRKNWMMFVLPFLRDKYLINITKLCAQFNVSRQYLYRFINGLSVPDHDTFANIFEFVHDLYIDIIKFEFTTDFDKMVEFFDNKYKEEENDSE